VENALFSMEINTSPGTDNITIEFYQHCSEVVTMISWNYLKLFMREIWMFKGLTMG
jgi:hypothetical protein